MSNTGNFAAIKMTREQKKIKIQAGARVAYDAQFNSCTFSYV